MHAQKSDHVRTQQGAVDLQVRRETSEEKPWSWTDPGGTMPLSFKPHSLIYMCMYVYVYIYLFICQGSHSPFIYCVCSCQKGMEPSASSVIYSPAWHSAREGARLKFYFTAAFKFYVLSILSSEPKL